MVDISHPFLQVARNDYLRIDDRPDPALLDHSRRSAMARRCAVNPAASLGNELYSRTRQMEMITDADLDRLSFEESEKIQGD